MPIQSWDHKDNVKVEHLGEVVDVRSYKATRNVSDTLDCSDFQTVTVTEALVYIGRTADDTMIRRTMVPNHEASWPKGYYKAGETLDPIDRFQWIDCSNLFAWRGADRREATIDDVRHPDVVIDLCDYHEAMQAKQKIDEEIKAHAALAEAAKKAEQEKNRPVVGKPMKVVSGRKVKPGTLGTVAYVHDSGRVLLKADNVWRDRKAEGQWVDARHLVAR